VDSSDAVPPTEVPNGDILFPSNMDSLVLDPPLEVSKSKKLVKKVTKEITMQPKMKEVSPLNLEEKGKLLHGSPLSVGQNSNIELYEWKMDNYESKSRECWTVEAIPKESL
jgi:hypothetical protein